MKNHTISVVLLVGISLIIVVFAIPTLHVARDSSGGETLGSDHLAVDIPEFAPWDGSEGSGLEAAPVMGSAPLHADELSAEVIPAPVPPRSAPTFDMYKVVLGVNEQITLPGEPADLQIWIGSEDFAPDFSAGINRDESSIAALGESAQIEAYAPAFRIEPQASRCIRIHPSGSALRFKLYPEHAGEFAVGATINLFDSTDCSGPPVPKTTAELKVQVKVNVAGWLQRRLSELWGVFWENALEFWATLVGLVFATVLFLIRGKLKQWFGYKAE